MAAPRIFSLSRYITTAVKPSSTTVLARAFSSTTTTTKAAATKATTIPRFSLLRPLSAAVRLSTSPASVASFSRAFSSRRPNQDDSNRPSKETVLLDGCDFEHWLVVVDPPPQDWTRDQIISHYIQILAKFVGSEEEARMKIYSVSTRHYYAFGALISEEMSYKVKEMEGIRWVLPDSYLDVRNKDYGGEPFIEGQAVPYDPKYHEEWVRNNQKAQERNRRNDRPRSGGDRSRNFERRQRPQGDQNNANPGGNMGGMPRQGGPPNHGGPGPNMQPYHAGPGQNMQPNNAGYRPNNAGYPQNMPPNNAGYAQNMPPSNAGYTPNMQPNAGYAQNNPGFAYNMQPNMGGGAPSYGGQGNPGYANTVPNQQGGAAVPYQNTQMGGQPQYPPQSNVDGGGYQSQNVPGRDSPQY